MVDDHEHCDGDGDGNDGHDDGNDVAFESESGANCKLYMGCAAAAALPCIHLDKCDDDDNDDDDDDNHDDYDKYNPDEI